jgi:hypothetical protein
MTNFRSRSRCYATALTLSLVAAISQAVGASTPAGGSATPQADAAAQENVTASAPGGKSITQPLSPTALNVFNFGADSFKVQYPAGSSFSGIDMTVNAVPVSQAAFSKRLSGTQFANGVCVVYTASPGNCIDYQVTCSTAGGQSIQCPSSSSEISVWTSYDSTQLVINPGLLSAEIGTNAWGNTFDSYFMMAIDPTAHGHTNGFSEFVSVARGVTNAQGLGELTFNAPIRPTDPRVFPAGEAIPLSFHLASVLHCGQPVSDAGASLSVVQIADGQGRPTTRIVYAKQQVFKYENGNYAFSLQAQTFPPGVYILTFYGNAFLSQATYLTIQ